MYKFNVSAPGRVFLHGEPVRSGKLCIVASLDMRTKLAFTSLPTVSVQEDFIEIDFFSIKLHVKIPLRTFMKHFYGENANQTLTDVQLQKTVRDFISGLKDYKGIFEPRNQTHCLSLQGFFFLLVRVAYETHINITSSFTVKVTTELPIGEGLGSSASFAVCLAACFWRWSLLQRAIVHYEFDDQDCSKIMRYARSCDRIVFNSSTMIDTVVSVYGSIHMFQEDMALEVFHKMSSLKILLVFSNVSQKMTINQNMQLEIMKHSFPFVKNILESIDAIVIMCVGTLGMIEEKVSDFIDPDSRVISHKNQFLVPLDCCKMLRRLIHTNQALLSALGMTHPNMNIICAIARDFSLAGKLTGKSTGGYVFILLEPNSTDELVKNLINVLKTHGFPVKLTSLNCSGVRVE